MIQYLAVIGFFIVALLLFGFALHFSKYKKRASGCCGGGHCSIDGENSDKQVHSCYRDKLNFIDNNIKS
jgi:hypothetical protein